MTNNNPLWRIRGTNTYLLATVHVGSEEVLLHPKTIEVVEAAARFIFEHNLDRPLDTAAFTLPEGVRLGKLVGERVSNAAGLAWRQLDLIPRRVFTTG